MNILEIGQIEIACFCFVVPGKFLLPLTNEPLSGLNSESNGRNGALKMYEYFLFTRNIWKLRTYAYAMRMEMNGQVRGLHRSGHQLKLLERIHIIVWSAFVHCPLTL
jgi:hypothetical protein